MENKLLISLPCTIREIKTKIDNFDSCDVVVCQYDGDGDSLYIIPVEEEKVKPDPIQQTNNFVQTLEAENKATEGSKMVFK